MNRNSPRILVIEDNPGDFVLVEEFITEQFDRPVIDHSADFKHAVVALTECECPYDVILLDLSLPDRSGESLIEAIIQVCTGAPVIVLTGYSDIKFSVKSLSLGVADYLLKEELTPTIIYKSIIYSWERQRYIAELAASEKSYSDLFKLSPQPMWVFDMQTFRFLEVNDAAIAHYGYSHDEFLSMTIMDIRPPDEQEKLRELISSLGEDRELVRQGIFIHQKKNGELIQVEIQSNTINTHGVTARLVLANDVTERFRYIKAIEEQNERLREISWMQSHVIRAPLSRIMGLIPLIGMFKEDTTTNTRSELTEMLGFLEISAKELDQVIRDITAKSNAG